MNSKGSEKVLILGASDKSDRYSYKAMKMLHDHGHTTVLVHPVLDNIEGYPVLKDISDCKEAIDTITVYVNPSISSGLESKILKMMPKRVIFNPGSENEMLQVSLVKAGILTMNACTLVLLSTKQF